VEYSVHRLEPLFNPRNIAVIGASRNPKKAGYIVLKNLVDNMRTYGYGFKVYPINPYAESILGVRAYSSITRIEDEVDLAVIVVPAEKVPSVLEECGEKGVKVAIILSAGFSEVGNVELEKEVKRIGNKYGLRILGPNCLGVYDSYSGVDTIFLPCSKVLPDGRTLTSLPRPRRGDISLISQSGAVGVAVLDYMASEGIGISKFISYGNKVDIDETDILEYLLYDDSTRVIMMYIENIERGRRFIEVAREVSKRKPIVVLKAGRTPSGARAVLSHTAAVAGIDKIYEAAFKMCGILRVYTLEDLMDSSKALAYQPPAKGNNIAILTDGGGAGVMASDEAETLGLKLARLDEKTRQEFRKLKSSGAIVDFAITENPIDLTGSATTEMYEICLQLLLEDPNVDGVILIVLHHVPLIVDIEDLVHRCSKLIKEYGKPTTVGTIGGSEMAILLRRMFNEKCIPAYTSPERACRALAQLVKYGLYLKRFS